MGDHKSTYVFKAPASTALMAPRMTRPVGSIPLTSAERRPRWCSERLAGAGVQPSGGRASRVLFSILFGGDVAFRARFWGEHYLSSLLEDALASHLTCKYKIARESMMHHLVKHMLASILQSWFAQKWIPVLGTANRVARAPKTAWLVETAGRPARGKGGCL